MISFVFASCITNDFLNTFYCVGHSKAVRDICFNNEGTTFLSASYDRYCKLWDTETGIILTAPLICWVFFYHLRVNLHLFIKSVLGECLGKFTNRKIPYCVQFNPDEVK